MAPTITCDCGETFPASTGGSGGLGGQPTYSHPTCPKCGASWLYDPTSGKTWRDTRDDDE